MNLIKINEENLQTVIVKGSIGLLAAICIGGFFAVSPRFAWSTLAGGILVLANNCWLKNILERVLAGHAENAARYAVIRYLLRLSLIAVAVVILFRLQVDIAGLFVGLSILVFSSVIVSIYSLVHHKGEAS
jgi:asparagine N-glycosylation enzyme membrane subunit Stt3